MATACLGHADPLLRNYDLAWRAIDLTGSGSRRTATEEGVLIEKFRVLGIVMVKSSPFL